MGELVNELTVVTKCSLHVRFAFCEVFEASLPCNGVGVLKNPLDGSHCLAGMLMLYVLSLFFQGKYCFFKVKDGWSRHTANVRREMASARTCA